MAFSFHSGRRAAMSEINVTPLVDVMLVLLIIFMVTAPMMQEGITMNLPDAPGEALAKEQQTEQIVISVSEAGNIYFNDVPVKEEELPARLSEATKDKPKSQVYVRADTIVQYGIVAKILGAVMSAGIKDVSLITASKEEPTTKK